MAFESIFQSLRVRNPTVKNRGSRATEPGSVDNDEDARHRSRVSTIAEIVSVSPPSTSL